MRSDPRSATVEMLLLRHAPSSWNEQRRRQGWSDQPLTLAGLDAARRYAERAPAGLAAVVCSDLRRASGTATAIAGVLGLAPVHEEAALREQSQGAWTGLTREEIKLRWPARFAERPRRPVGGEPSDVFLDRVLVGLRRVAALHTGRRILVVTHSGVIRTLELALGVEAPAVPHLEGRWFTATGKAAPEATMDAGWLRVGAMTTGRAAARCASAGGGR